MKKFRRMLALALCLLLAFSCTLAEEALAPTLAPLIETSVEASAEPTVEPTAEPAVEPTAEPAVEVTSESTVEPVVESTVEPTAEPTVEPVVESTAEPTVEPTVEPTAEPTVEATVEATAEPTLEPTPEPTAEPTVEPTVEPTPEPTVEPTPEPHPMMCLDAAALVLGVKEKYTLAVSFSDGGKYKLGFASENTKIAKVSKTGQITPAAVGETRIFVTSEFGEEIAVSLTVKKAPYNLKLDVQRLKLGAGQTYQLQLSVPEDCAGALKWVNSKPSVASVDENGLITAHKKGSAYIRVEAYNGKYASVTVQVYTAPDALELDKDEMVLGVGQPGKLSLKKELTQESYAFSSDRPEIASVNAKGEITALMPGEAVISTETYNGLKDSCRVIVKPAPERIAFREQEIVIHAKDSYTLLPLEGAEGMEVQLKSSTSRFRINGNTITASSAGTGTLTATTYNGLTATVALRGVAAPKTIAFRESEITLFMGTDIVPALDADCSYSLASSDSAVVRVDGRCIFAVAPGDAEIKATSFNKKTAVLKVHVPPLPDSLALSDVQLALGCGDIYPLKPVIPGGQGSSFAYTSSNPEIAAVDQGGRISAVAPGRAVIRVETLNGLTADCEATVYAAPESVSLTPQRVVRSMEQGPFDLEIAFGGENAGGRYSIESSNTDVVVVDHSGHVTPVAPGSAVITIKTYNGHSAVAKLTLGEKPASMELADIRIALGDCIPVSPRFDKGCESYRLSSADPAVAAVSGDSIRGLSLGTTVLTVESAGGLSAACTVTVVEAPTGFSLSHSEEKLVLGVAPKLQLSGNPLPHGVGSIYWESSDPAIARVDENGLVTALAMGDCVIRAVTYDGLHSAECAIHVLGVLDGVKIGIDPGHQRKGDHHTEPISPTSTRRKARTSSGTKGKATKIMEYETNLTIGLKLRDALEALGAQVYMTRTHHDVNISNVERAVMMNELGVDLVLRIHCNSASRSSARGMSIYVRKTGVGKDESVRAAQLILDAMLAETGAVNQGVKESDEYTGLNWSTVPSMLMELGYMSNRAEDVLLNTPEYQDQMIAGMVSGICSYMGRPTPGEITENQEAAK